MDEVTRDTEQQLLTAGQMLATTAAFDGTVNGVSVNELVQQISHYNRTIAALVSSAQNLLTELGQDFTQATDVWTNISALETTIQELLGDSNVTESHLETVESQLEQLDQQRGDLRLNLTHLFDLTMELTRQLTRLNGSVANASRDSDGASVSGEELASQLAALRSQTDMVLDLARELNASIQTTREASQHLVENYTTIIVSLPLITL